VDDDDVLVADSGRRPGLPDEPLAGRPAGRQGRCQNLDGHHAVELVVERLQNSAEPALPQHLQNFVMRQPAERPGLAAGCQEPEGVIAGRPAGPRLGLRLIGVGRPRAGAIDRLCLVPGGRAAALRQRRRAQVTPNLPV